MIVELFEALRKESEKSKEDKKTTKKEPVVIKYQRDGEDPKKSRVFSDRQAAESSDLYKQLRRDMKSGKVSALQIMTVSDNRKMTGESFDKPKKSIKEGIIIANKKSNDPEEIAEGNNKFSTGNIAYDVIHELMADIGLKKQGNIKDYFKNDFRKIKRGCRKLRNQDNVAEMLNNIMSDAKSVDDLVFYDGAKYFKDHGLSQVR